MIYDKFADLSTVLSVVNPALAANGLAVVHTTKVLEGKNKIILDPGEFYILSSREFVSISPNLAAEMTPYLPMIGEFRVHYAGFFDPGFGDTNDLSKASQGVLEVRSLDVPFYIEDKQIIARLKYEKLAETPSKLYGVDIGSTYQSQGLKLSKHFID